MDSSNSAVLLAALGIVSASVAALTWVIRFLFQKILPVLESMKNSLDANTSQTKKTEEAIINVRKAVDKIPVKLQNVADSQAEALKDMPAQTIHHQTVKEQSMEKKNGR